MALMNLKSNLSWYGKKPTTTNVMSDKDASGFTPNQQALSPSRFIGITGVPGAMLYNYKGESPFVKADTEIGVNFIFDTTTGKEAGAKGFTTNLQVGDPSQFLGIIGAPGAMHYNITSPAADISQNLRYERNTWTRGATGNYTTKFSQPDKDYVISPPDAKGWDVNGNQIISHDFPTPSANSFNINNGLGSRKAQGAVGHPFPNGTEGVYDWKPSAHTGWHQENKYSDTIQSLKTLGLADTYTNNTPIDDMYNKFNLREDAFNPSYIKQPYILRGIQKEGESDPQRYGFEGTTAGYISSTLDLPRGGILTAGHRALLDTLRVAKFMVSPKGLAWSVKQFGLHLMNPNTEGTSGLPRKPLGKNSPKLWTPINTLLQPLAGLAGMHVRRSGLFPVDIGVIAGATPHNYEDVLAQNTTPETNRLARMRSEHLTVRYERPNEQGIALGLIDSFQQLNPLNDTGGGLLSGFTGPGSLLGIGSSFKMKRPFLERTNFMNLGMYNDTNAHQGLQSSMIYTFNHNHYGMPYQSQFDDNSLTLFNLSDRPDFDDGLNFPGERGGKFKFLNIKKSLKQLSEEIGTKDELGPWVEEQGGGISTSTGNGLTKLDDYKRMAYGKIPKRPAGTTKIIDFGQISYIDGKRKSLDIDGEYTGKDNFAKAIKSIQQLDDADTSLVKFIIGNTTFRAYISSLSDSFAPGWDGAEDQGRADPRYQYTNFERTLSVDFAVVSFNKEDYIKQWKNLKSLALQTYPQYGGSGFYNTASNVTIGDMFKRVPMIITDLSYDFDNEMPWEISKGKAAPMYANVSISFTVLGSKPTKGSKVYNHI